MGELEAAGWCEVEGRDSSGPKTWRVDPRVHARFAERAERERAERDVKRARIIEAGKVRRWINGEDAAPFTTGGIFG